LKDTYYKALSISDIATVQDEAAGKLNFTVSNTGTEIISTLQIKLTYLDGQERVTWVQPYYLQNSVDFSSRSVSLHSANPKVQNAMHIAPKQMINPLNH